MRFRPDSEHDELRQVVRRLLGESAVITSSALKRAYRDELLTGRPTATMVFLLVSKEVLERRLMTRPDHFFPEKLLGSQLAAFEPPAPDEGIETVLSEGDPAQTAAKIIALLWPEGEPGTQLPPERATPRTPGARKPGHSLGSLAGIT